MNATLPPVSCICLTYGRPALLEEAIQSFLLQDYAGEKELIVLNDFGEQVLRFDHPQVHVINLSCRFRTVGEKCNAAAALAAHDLVFVWDDDDIYLPHRISFSVAHFDPAKGFFKPAQAWMLNDGVLSGPEANVFHAGSCWSRGLFDAVGGYAPMGNGYDQEIEARFEEVRPGSAAAFAVQPQKIAYIYRWGGTGSFHMSAFGREAPDRNLEQQAVADYVAKRAQVGAVPLGEIRLSPHWNADYCGIVQELLRKRG